MATIVTRSGKGSALTHTEMDNNFTNLNTDKLENGGDTITGALVFNTGANTNASVDEDGVDRSSGSAETFNIQNSGAGAMTLQVDGNTVWHAGNDGSGSGLDADTVDGNGASALLSRSNHTGTQTMSTISDAGALATLNSVGQGQVDNSAIGQGELKTASVEYRQDTTELIVSSTAGQYAFNWEVFEYSGNEADPVLSYVTQGNDTNAFSFGTTIATKAEATAGRDWWRQYTLAGSGSTAYDAALRERYVQSSPPYDLGMGECGLFIFALVDKNGDIRATVCAPDPCWALNGPTRITPDIKRNGKKYKLVPRRVDGEVVLEEVEITQEIKHADRHWIPHPFSKFDPELTPILINPASKEMHDLLIFHQFAEKNEDRPGKILKDKYIQVGNTNVEPTAPKEIMTVAPKWKNTKGK